MKERISEHAGAKNASAPRVLTDKMLHCGLRWKRRRLLKTTRSCSGIVEVVGMYFPDRNSLEIQKCQNICQSYSNERAKDVKAISALARPFKTTMLAVLGML